MIDAKRTGTFPLHFTPFIGREQEIKEIIDTLNDPSCHLLTLVGTGGGGKTRLATEIMQRMGEEFEDGAHFVALQGVSSPEFLATAIADAVTHGLRATNEAEAPLLNYLSNKSMLLVLDNFEHLLSGETLLTKIIHKAPHVKLLITSREVLNLREEWLYPVGGMRVPTFQNDEDLNNYASIQLFLEHARRVKRDFSIDEERSAVIRICRAVEGMPLGLELAASWLRVLPVTEIAVEIERGLDFLQTHLRDVPERHRSMRAVFDQSWKLLSETERDVLKRLSVFYGGFDREAGQYVADASLRVLTSLVDKSMLRLEDNGRYSIHELLRQYAEEHLLKDENEARKTREAMDVHYVNFMANHGYTMTKERSVEVIKRVDAEFENLRVVWGRICQEKRRDLIKDALSIVVMYYDYRGLFVESERAFRLALHAYEDDPLTADDAVILAELYTWLGWSSIRLGKIDMAEDMLNQSQALYDTYDVKHRSGLGSDILNARAILTEIKGDFETSILLAQQAIERAKERGDDQPNLALAYYALAGAERSLGQLENAKEHSRLAYETARANGELWFSGYCLVVQGAAARAMGDYDEAERCFQECYNIREAIQDPEGMGLALLNLGAVALRRGNPNRALALYNRSVALYEDLFDRGGLSSALAGRSAALYTLGQFATSREDIDRGLDLAIEGSLVPRELALVAELGALLLKTGEREYGVSLLKALLQNPSLEQETRDLVTQYLSSVDASLVEQAPVKTENLRKLTYEARKVLRNLSLTDIPSQEQASNSPRSEDKMFAEGMLDPLTERELEILRLLAEGLTNQQIADRLVVVIGTIKAHNHSIFSKLDVRNRVQAVTRAQELKLI